MKQMNGLKATKQIIGKFPEAKILLVTQYNDGELREAATEAGACGFVLKENLAELRQFLHAPVDPVEPPANKRKRLSKILKIGRRLNFNSNSG